MSTDSERGDFRRVQEWTADPGETEEGVEDKEEGCSGKLFGSTTGGQKRRDNDEGEGHSSGGDHEDLSSTNSLNEEKGETRAHGVFGTDTGG